MPALGAGRAADGFAVRNLGRVECDVEMIAAFDLADDRLNMRLTGAVEQEVLRLRVADEAQALVLLHDAVDGLAEFVLVVAALSRNGVGDGWLGQLDGRVLDWGGLIVQRVAGERIFQLGHSANVAGVQFVHREQRLAEGAGDVGEPFVGAFGSVDKVGVVLQDAADDAEIGQAPGEGIGDRFEDVDGEWSGVVHLAVLFVTVPSAVGVFVFAGVGQ